ncbi:MAG: hypothetical protein F4X66_07050 [Chloroflexi bacterium]|nr:hypothetical protein [Chloroflexota bacterium]
MNQQNLPEGWAVTTMGEVATIVGGGTPKTSEPSNFEGGEIPWITPADLSGYGGKSISRGARNITVRGLKNSSARLLPEGSVLLSTRAPIGYVAVASQPVATNQGFKSFVLADGLESGFVYHYLLSARQLLESLGGGTTFKELSGADAATIPLPLPPLAEQHRIVAAIETQLTRLDASMAALRRAQANLKRYRASVLKEACEGRLVPIEAELAHSESREYEPAAVLLERILAQRRARWESQEKRRGKYREPSSPDTSALPQLPKGWTWTSLEAISELKGGVTKGQRYTSEQMLREVPYLRVANVQRGFLDLERITTIETSEENIERLRLNPGDVLFTEGGDRDKLGRGWVWNGEIEECIHQNHVFRARPLSDSVIPEFVSWWGNSFGQDFFSRFGKQTTNLASINLTVLSQFPIPLPPLAEQRRIVAEVERRLSVAQQAETAVEASLARAERLRQSILKQAFSGRLVPQNPNDEPASVLLERIKAEREAEAQASLAAKSKAGRRSRSKSAA